MLFGCQVPALLSEFLPCGHSPGNKNSLFSEAFVLHPATCLAQVVAGHQTGLEQEPPCPVPPEGKGKPEQAVRSAVVGKSQPTLLEIIKVIKAVQ